ncbi:adhesion G protein-coupled receptor A2 [Latimeria chalumnae]|uniref:Adhesion G protein-coupled receptor A2 n=1 Tax=Latimeria chalumnae TaxID=7897 RepID=H3ATS4_LATCH|nr:PREDICTED: G-protein coupled receptor 124 [Latimeria chalumnae]|eukprot:XP_006000352.1 PREDICTED: G-protein coupled receptor 124 [Latimeria chalumnae]
MDRKWNWDFMMVWMLGLLVFFFFRTEACPGLINSCNCVDERSKGLTIPTVRKKVICSNEELQEPPDPSLLPNRTVTLVLSNNKITVLKNSSFFGLHTLEKLDLKNNLISTIWPGAFHGLSELKRLDLSNNRIGCLTSAVFHGLRSLTKLNLSGNIFSSLQPGLFDFLPSLRVIDFSSEYLMCDCNMQWALAWSKNNSVRISEETTCAYPSALSAYQFKSLKESQLSCSGPLELHTLELIPSLRQVVFQRDRLPFQCTATYLDNSTQIQWYHNGELVQEDKEMEVILEDSVIHDCSLITSELILLNIHVSANGEWECMISTPRGNVSKKVEIVVLEPSASYCPAERITNNRGDFRWPRTLAGITAYQPCRHYPFTSITVNLGSQENRALRRCDRTGCWEEGDYSSCLYTNDITSALHALFVMPINVSNALTLAHQLRAYTAEAVNFSDKMDVIYVAQMIEKFIQYVDQVRELGDVIVEMASNMMLVDEHILWMAQKEQKACTSIVQSVEKIAGLTLTSNAQDTSISSRNIVLEAYLIKPASYIGLSCTAYQRREAGLGSRSPLQDTTRQEQETEHQPEQQLKFRCTTGNINISLANFHMKNSVALASVQLPQSLFSPMLSSSFSKNCKLQFVVFRNGKLFCSPGNSTGLADNGKRRSISTPVVYTGIDNCDISNITDPVTVSLRHFAQGMDPVAAHWDFEVLGGYGGWISEGCHIAHAEPNITIIHCGHLNNYAVLMELNSFPTVPVGNAEVLHPVIYTCTAILLLCLFTTIITYIVNHGTIHVSRKSWHMLLNLCFHIAMTTAVFAGGITLTNYHIICQAVGIILHYSSLSTMLWMGVKARVIYKEVTRKPPPQQEGDPTQPPQRPMLRFYLIAGGIPLIICGITAAVNINNYGEEKPYCWLVWRPSLGAFYVPAAFILLVSWIYLLCTGIHLRCKPKNLKDPPVPAEAQQRLGGSNNLLTDSGSASVTMNSGILAPVTDGVYTMKAQFLALLITHFLYIALWAFGALAVSQGWYYDVIFSCLYGMTAIMLGLFIIIHHCAKRQDIQSSWFTCCPSYTRALPMQAYIHPGATMEDGSQVFIGCNPEVAHSIKSSSPSSTNSNMGHCKLTNLQVAQNQAENVPPKSKCYAENEHANNKNLSIPRHANNLHGRRNHKTRTKVHREGKHHRLKVLRGPLSDHPSSENGSIHNSLSESYHSSRSSPLNNRIKGGTAVEQEVSLTQSEGSDTSGQQPLGNTKEQRRSASRENLKQASTIEKEAKRRSYPLNTSSQNGALKGSKYDINVSSADSTTGMKTGLWKSETTV